MDPCGCPWCVTPRTRCACSRSAEGSRRARASRTPRRGTPRSSSRGSRSSRWTGRLSTFSPRNGRRLRGRLRVGAGVGVRGMKKK